MAITARTQLQELLTLIFCALLFAPGFARTPGGADRSSEPDQVVFLNGDRVSGQLVEVTALTIRFKTKAMGEVSIKWEAVQEITSHNRWAVLNPQLDFDRNTYTRFSRAILRKLNGTPMLMLDEQPSVPLSGTSAVEFGDQQPSPQQFAGCRGPYPDSPFTPQTTSWFLDIKAPVTMVNGTQSQEQFGGNAALDVCENTKTNHSVFAVAGQHTRSWKVHQPFVTTDTFDGSFAQQHMFGRPDGAGVYGIAEMFFNTSLGMALEKSFGIGVFSPQFAKGNLSYSFRADVRFFDERLYSTSRSLKLAGIRLDERVGYKIGKKFSFNQHGWINPMINDAQALQAYAKIGPAITLSPWLSLSLSEEDDYLGNSPVGKRKNYLSSSIGLKIQHGQASSDK